MAQKKDFKVIRAHTGDKDYAVGDTRTEDPNKVKHLIGKCLEDPDAKPAKAKKKAPAKKKTAAKKK